MGTIETMKIDCEKIELEVGTLCFYDDIAIGELNEGITVTSDCMNLLLRTTLDHFKGRPFVYISNRINSYSVDPLNYTLLNNISNLRAMAVVSYNSINTSNAKIEKIFFNKDFEIFDSVKTAMVWSKKVLF